MVVRPQQVVSALRAAVRNENVRRVELAWGAAIAAEWVHFVALGVFAYQHGGTSAVGVAGLVRLMPAAAVAPFAASSGPLEYPLGRILSKAWMRMLVIVGGADTGVTCWCAGTLVLREK